MDVIVSMKDSGRRMVYHRPECIYVRRMKRENWMRLTQEWVENRGYCCCKYCGGLRGEMRTDNQIEEWKKTYHISIDYVKQTDTLYVRTGIGCWKIFYKESSGAMSFITEMNMIKTCLSGRRRTACTTGRRT